jgi:glycosyltransferase involved in cell wall biosynthesis
VRIVVTCDWFLKYAVAQSAGLARAGADVTLVCRAHANEFGGDAAERASVLGSARSAGVTVVEIPGRLSDVRVARRLIAIRRALARGRPEVVHAHDGADPRALALIPRAPTVLTVHDPSPHPGQPVPGAGKRWFLYGSRDTWRARADVIVVHSERLRPAVQLRGAQRCVVIPHGLEILSEPLAPPADPAVGFFGRLAPYKGLDVLSRAMPQVWQVRPEVRLRVAGAGSSGLDIEDSRVEIERAYLPESQLADFFARASLIALPYTEASQTGAGSVAIGFGLPVVVSRVGGLPDLALDPSYVVDAGDAAGLAAAILRHLDDGIDVRRRVLAELAGPRSWDSVAQASLQLYEQLRAGR